MRENPSVKVPVFARWDSRLQSKLALMVYIKSIAGNRTSTGRLNLE